MFVLVIMRGGINQAVRVGTEAELKALYPNAAWMDFGYKQGAHITEYITADLFEAKPAVTEQDLRFGAVSTQRRAYGTDYLLPTGVTIRVPDEGLTRKEPDGQGAFRDTGEVLPVSFVVFNRSGQHVGTYKTERGALRAAERAADHHKED